MTIEQYLMERDSGRTLEEIQADYLFSEATVWTLELGYQCYLKKMPLDEAVNLVKNT
ncbi:hypothetical protein AAGS61_08690 [Lysinibacillus sp. KU-BSD001]|uniref:hypothetical protein n=1 Tax=Lysinibacillus sp. KU-BSD001 TaxID=3141328 RepID=UPI0036E2ED24